MSSTVFFKQHYKPRTEPSTPGLNVRHLQYIATRPGAVYNVGCSFGLWGNLEDGKTARDITDLERAKRTVRAASKDHTLYRAIVSVGKQDAQEYGLYHRERWEQLVNDHIRDIAKEMGMKPETVRWCASFHCAKGHPHVHILYWDSSDEPRPENVPKPLWDAKAEHLRAAFAGDIHRDEIRQVQKAQREQMQAVRTALRAMCREANPETVPNLPRLYKSGRLHGLAAHMGELLRTLPKSGSLRYAYLPAQYRSRVDAFVEDALKDPELLAQQENYLSLTRQISKLYANGEQGAARAADQAMEKLRTELGNETMRAVKLLRDELVVVAPETDDEARALIDAVRGDVLPSLEAYHALLAALPRERIPAECMARQIPDYNALFGKAVGEVLADARVRLRLQGYALHHAGIDLDALPPARRADGAPHTLFGKGLTEQQWQAYQQSYHEALKVLKDGIAEQARRDAGWEDEALMTCCARLLVRMVGGVSQAAAQQRNRAVLQRLASAPRSKDRSREAKQDYSVTQQNPSMWDGDFQH